MQTLDLAMLIDSIRKSVGGLSNIRQCTPGQQAYFGALGSMMDELEKLKRICEVLRLPMSCQAIGQAMREFELLPRAIEDGLVDGTYADKEVHRVMTTLRDETRLQFFLQIPEPDRALYANVRPFGPEVAEAFPAAGTDVEEAAKCLALDRGTASVFHSMRVMEFGLRALISESFGNPEFLKGKATWGTIYGRIRDESKKPDGTIRAAWAGRQERLSHLALLASQVADAHRNPTMHCERMYTVEQARDVFNATGAFMRRLAEDFGFGTTAA